MVGNSMGASVSMMLGELLLGLFVGIFVSSLRYCEGNALCLVALGREDGEIVGMPFCDEGEKEGAFSKQVPGRGGTKSWKFVSDDEDFQFHSQ